MRPRREAPQGRRVVRTNRSNHANAPSRSDGSTSDISVVPGRRAVVEAVAAIALSAGVLTGAAAAGSTTPPAVATAPPTPAPAPTTTVGPAPKATGFAGAPGPSTTAATAPTATTVPAPSAPTPPAPVPAPEPEPLAAADPCAAMFALVRADPPAGWVVECAPGRSGLWGEANPVRRDVIVYLRPSWSTTTAARTLAHELGHAYDWALLTDADRAAWMQARGLRGGWGNECPAGQICADMDRPAGDWAEAVGELLVPGTDLWDSNLGGLPDDDQLALVASILAGHGIIVQPTG